MLPTRWFSVHNGPIVRYWLNDQFLLSRNGGNSREIVIFWARSNNEVYKQDQEVFKKYVCKFGKHNRRRRGKYIGIGEGLVEADYIRFCFQGFLLILTVAN